MTRTPLTYRRWFRPTLIAVLSIACVTTLIIFFYSLQQFHSAGELEAHYKKRQAFEQSNAGFRVSTLETWMTFDYINVVFKLPPTFLKNALGIDDSQYPVLRIDKWAREQNEDPNQVLGEIQTLIRQNSH